ncbi:MAG: NACHT domain-containing protein [Cyanobacteria bacterium P01_D01_bin.156]
MSEQPSKPPDQNLNIADSILGTVQIGGIAGQDLTVNQTQIEGGVHITNIYSSIQVPQAPLGLAKTLSRQEYEWRKVLLSKIKQFWIDGVLKKSLHNQVLIKLGLEERSELVPNPLDEIGEFSSASRQTFPLGTTAENIFENIGAGRTMLISGEPGSGKTVTLLKLAESLINRTEKDLSQSLPVVLNLSSWANQQKTIADWLIQQLDETYKVSKSLGRIWLDEEQFILLLDGLDEVSTNAQDKCIHALNQFIRDYGRTEIVVCCRIGVYESLSEQLNLRSAIYLQSLTPKQIHQYLEQVGKHLAELRTYINHNQEIMALASSPLILSIMSLAYQDESFDKFSQIDSGESFRRRLFDAYIERMLERRGTTKDKYFNSSTKRWLTWLAQHMVESSQTIFLIEQMQPSCYGERLQRIQYHRESALIIGIFVGLLFGFSDSIKPVENLKWSWKEAYDFLRRGLKWGPYLGLLSGVITGIGTTIGIFLWSLFWSVLGWIFQGLQNLRPFSLFILDSIDLIEIIIAILLAIAFILVAGLLTGLVGLFIGLLIGIWFGLVSGMRNGITSTEMNKRNLPNQGIWKSAQNALMIGLIFGITIGLFYGFVFGLMFGTPYGITCGLIVGLLSGILCCLPFGGGACLQHFSLRFMLQRMDYIPWNYARFLDHAADRLFLQKVGGGYIFVHRMLLEHFAEMEL